MNIRLLIKSIAAAGLLCVSNVQAENGPFTKVESIHSRTDTVAPFIRFTAGAMPGCYGDSSGYLRMSDEKGSERTFSILLAALASKQSVRVYYEFNDVAPGYNGWGLCQITAIEIK